MGHRQHNWKTHDTIRVICVYQPEALCTTNRRATRMIELPESQGYVCRLVNGTGMTRTFDKNRLGRKLKTLLQTLAQSKQIQFYCLPASEFLQGVLTL